MPASSTAGTRVDLERGVNGAGIIVSAACYTVTLKQHSAVAGRNVEQKKPRDVSLVQFLVPPYLSWASSVFRFSYLSQKVSVVRLFSASRRAHQTLCLVRSEQTCSWQQQS